MLMLETMNLKLDYVHFDILFDGSLEEGEEGLEGSGDRNCK